MQQQVFKKYNDSSVYTISFFLNLGWMFFSPVLLAIPFTILFLNQNGGRIELLESQEYLLGSFVPQLISYVLPIGIIAVVFRKSLKKDAIEFGKKWYIYIFYIIIGLISIIMLSGLLNLIYELLGIQGDSSNQEFIERAINSSLKPVVFLMVVFGAPIYEELIFRKFLFGFCEKTLKVNRWIAVTISSVIFAFIHVASDFSSYIFFFQYLALAIVITLSYTLSNNNIYVPVGIHFIQNLLSFLVI